MTHDADLLCIQTIRTLSIDAVQKANSGHPGTPMALAPVVYALWQDFLRYDPDEPLWPDRDRFVLSCGHASMLLYSMLHLAQVKSARREHEKPSSSPLAVPLEEIVRFRQIDSRTPGHPEYGWTTGVETTTGPLGQGCANSVGMAIAQRWLSARYDRPGLELFAHRVWVLCSDGDLMEGVANEAASIAGHLGLANLCWVYDNNKITIEGDTDLAFSEDVATRFVGLGWNVTRVADANDLAMLRRALAVARGERRRPTLVIVDSQIGWGAPNKQGKHSAHGEPLGEDEVRAAKRAYGWPEGETFRVPKEAYATLAAGLGQRGKELSAAWREKRARYDKDHPAQAKELAAIERGELPAGWEAGAPTFPADAKGLATRDSAGKALNALAPAVPWLVGGSADLAPSTKTLLSTPDAGHLSAGNPGGRNLHFGVREHAMASICNGLALSGLRPYCATFLIFSDYLKPALRLSAIMELPVVYVFTHDSIGVGEDGPTHQPIEQLAQLRATPGTVTIRPCDANEASEAWKVALARHDGPTALVLTRQALPTLDRSKLAPAANLAKGAYVLADAPVGAPQVILIGTGSEVSLCLAARDELAKQGVQARVVSMPSWELFERQPKAWRESVLPPDVTARVSVEQATAFGWSRWVGLEGASVAMASYGASAPISDLQKKFGFTVAEVVRRAKEQLPTAAAPR